MSKEVNELCTVEYMDELAASEYREPWRRGVMESALTGYERVIDKVRKGEIPRNRPGISSKTSRRAKKLVGKKTWFLPKEREKKSPGDRSDQEQQTCKKNQCR